jgi:hypothetical protein
VNLLAVEDAQLMQADKIIEITLMQYYDFIFLSC